MTDSDKPKTTTVDIEDSYATRKKAIVAVVVDDIQRGGEIAQAIKKYFELDERG